MTKPRLVYFDFSGSRGEECRIALHLAKIDFEDVRVPNVDWPVMKPSTPFGSMPILELPDHLPLAQSNAILVYIGRAYGFHPTDLFEAARHEALMCHVEDLRHAMSPSMHMKDEAQKKVAREALARDVIPVWATNAEKQLGEGPFVQDSRLNVVDIKLYMVVRWILSGTIDYISASVLNHCPKLISLHEAVAQHPDVRAWLERRSS